MCPPAIKQDPDALTCLLCRRADKEGDDKYRYGPMYSSKYMGTLVTVHYFCLLFACGLATAAGDPPAGIQGFAEADILKEVARGSKLKCNFCKKSGATLGCCVSKCKRTYHLPCARESNQVHFIAKEPYESFCRTHNKLEAIAVDDDSRICSSCSDPVVLTKQMTDVIQCSCCKHVCHWLCVQKFAYIAGLCHFKCSFCNCNNLREAGLSRKQAKKAKKCKKKYVAAARDRGVYIPKKDADWELDDSFSGHDEEYDTCDIVDKDGKSACICEKGPKYDEPQHKRFSWYIVLCSVCGGHGCHRQCRGIKAKDCDDWTCDLCSNIIDKSAAAAKKENVSPATARHTAPAQMKAMASASATAPAHPESVTVKIEAAENASSSQPSVSNRSTPVPNLGLPGPCQVPSLPLYMARKLNLTPAASPQSAAKKRAEPGSTPAPSSERRVCASPSRSTAPSQTRPELSAVKKELPDISSPQRGSRPPAVVSLSPHAVHNLSLTPIVSLQSAAKKRPVTDVAVGEKRFFAPARTSTPMAKKIKEEIICLSDSD